MLQPFKLKNPLGMPYTMDQDDIWNTKRALVDLGHYKVPDHGLNPYADRIMIEGIKSFQSDKGLKVDGVMKPDGPTHETLSKVLKNRGIVAEQQKRPGTIWDEVDRSKKPIGFLDLVLKSVISKNQDKGTIGNTNLSHHTANPPKSPESKKKSKGETQVAFAPAIPVGVEATAFIARIVGPQVLRALGLGAGVAAGKKIGDELQQRTDQGSTSERTDQATPLPPIPPSEPGDDPRPKMEELPATPPFEHIDPSRPIPENNEPAIYVHPIPDDELGKLSQILDNRRGKPETQEELVDIRDQILKQNPDWKHTGGGRNQSDGTDIPEKHIPGPGRKFGDSRPGGNFSDLTFETPKGRTVHVQSVDVDRNGKPTNRELKAAERIRRRTNADVILIPKGWQKRRR